MTKAQKRKNQKGFTLIELLVVMGILAVLLAIVLIAINPLRQFAQANNRKRLSDVNAILNAFGAYTADNAGVAPSDLTSTPSEITKTDCNLLVPKYISALPTDPDSSSSWTSCNSFTTNYQVSISAGRITVAAPKTDTTNTDDKTVTVTR